MPSRSGIPARRLPLLAPAAAALIAGGWGGLGRQGWVAAPGAFASEHGALMVLGFLGTLIGLERAVGLSVPWALAAPVLSALGAALLPLNAGLAPPAFAAAAAILLVAHLEMLRIQRAPHVAAMTAAAGLLLAGVLAWAWNGSLPLAVPFWTGFLVLTIAGERLELSRVLLPGAAARGAFAALAAALVAGSLLGFGSLRLGALVTAAADVGLAAWLLGNDIARRNARRSGLLRFTGLALLAGYAWLGAGGAIALVSGGALSGPEHDAALHAVLLGFVMSMVFGHAPIVIRGVLGAVHPYTARLYAPLVLLQLSLLARIGGDVAGAPGLAGAGGLLGGVAIAAFVLNTVLTVRGRRPPTPAAAVTST